MRRNNGPPWAYVAPDGMTLRLTNRALPLPRRGVPMLLLGALAIAAALFGGCSTRCAPDEVIKAAGDSMQTSVDQANRNTDLVPGVAVSDTGSNSVAAPTTGSVETQTNNNAGAPQLQVHDLFGLERQAANVISSTSPAEGSVLRTLDRNEKRLSVVEDEIDANVGSPERKQELGALRSVLTAEHDALLGKLEVYAKQKIEDARALAPSLDLSRLEKIVAFVINQQQVGTDHQLTDEQSKATAEAMKAVYGREAPAGAVPTPGPEPVR